MSGSGTFRALAASTVLVAASLTLPIASATAATTYSGWSQRDDGPIGGTAITDTHDSADGDLALYTGPGQVGVEGKVGGHTYAANFATPDGQALQAGRTYPVKVTPYDWDAPGSLFRIMRDGLMCGKTPTELDTGYPTPIWAVGSFTVREITRDTQGKATSFAATYEINCQTIGGSVGFEGTIAVDANHEVAAIPAVPVSPGSLIGLATKVVGPQRSGMDDATFAWTNPAGVGDVEVDVIGLGAWTSQPLLLGSPETMRYRGRADRFVLTGLDFMDTQTVRFVPRGPTGRMGRPSSVRLVGSRVSTDDIVRVTIGQPLHVTGRLTESWDYADFKDVMNGPPIAGRRISLCLQPKDSRPRECTTADTTVTAADGTFSMTAAPRENTYYRVTVPVKGLMLSNEEYAVMAKVAPKTDLQAVEAVTAPTVAARQGLPAARATRSVRRGSTIHFSTLRARAGSTGVVKLQRLDGKKWHTVITRRIVRGSSRRVALPYREKRPGLHTYRVLKVADSRHVNGLSRTVHIRVR